MTAVTTGPVAIERFRCEKSFGSGCEEECEDHSIFFVKGLWMCGWCARLTLGVSPVKWCVDGLTDWASVRGEVEA